MSNQGELQSHRDLFTLRMRLRCAQAHLWHDPDEPEDGARTLQDIEPLYDEVQRLERAIAEFQPEDGASSCPIHDDPMFGDRNPPLGSTYLYHYTRVPVLPKIRRGHALRFGPFSSMNDPYEALEVHPTWMGLVTPGQSEISRRSPLCLTRDESERFERTDWIAEINAARRQVKVGSFSLDGDGQLRSFDLKNFWPDAVARRLHGQRGFAHPRMWAQYAADSAGVCLVFNFKKLSDAFESHCRARSLSHAVGSVRYASSDYGPSLGYIDIGMLLEHGGRGVIIDNYDSALLEKHDDWSDEAEYRFLVIDEPSDAFFLPIDPSLVEGIVLGPKFNRGRHGRFVTAFAKDFGIGGQIRQLDWAHGYCALSVIDLTLS